MESKQEKLLNKRNAELEKQLAQKNRDLEIEASLERVRARTMAMQRSEELAETVFILFQQFKELGENPDQATIGIINEEENVIEYWVTMYGSQINKVFKFSIDEPNVTYKIYKAWKAKETSLVIDLNGKGLHDFATYRESKGGARLNEGEKRRVINVAFFSKGLINVQSTESRSEESIRLLERFAGVFDQTYTRFLDLQKAEAQAREAQIEAALEKVRSRSLAMHQTDELREVVSVVFDKLHDLGIVMAEEAASIVIFTEGTNDLILWNAIPDQLYSKSFHIPYYDTTVITSLLGAKKAGIDFFTRNYTPAEKDHFWQWAVQYSDYKYIPDDRKKHILAAEHFACSVAFTKNSAILVSSYLGKLLTEKEGEILKRFARVFEQAYVRFLDLQKAEEQTREAQIELSLERVRAKTMAMHNSVHVGDTVATLFDELIKLGIENTARCGISIIGDNQEMEVWRASYDPDGKVDMVIGRLDMTIHPLLQGVFKAWKNKETAYAYELAGKDLKNYYREINNSPNFPAQFEIGSLPAKQFHNTFFFPEGAIFTFTLEPLSADEVKLFKRFAGVFGLTYRRFLDLKKAEEQAKESQIQLALERVRARTMAMQKSEELHEVIQLVYEQLLQLNFKLDNANFVLNYKESDDFDLWVAVPGARYATKIHIPYFDHPNFNNFNNAKEKGGLLTDTLRFEEKNSFFKYFFEHAPYVPEERKAAIFNTPGYARSTVFMKNVALSILNYRGIPFSEDENATVMRFGQVFDQTYTRFNDLKLAEEQARESKIEAALEKVRGKALAMYNSADLTSTASMVFTELRKLGINPIRCGVGIFNRGSRKVALYAATTSADGDGLGLLGWVMLESHPVLDEIYESLLNNEDYFPVLKGKQLKAYYENLLSGLSLPTLPDFHPGEEQYGHFFPFPGGCLYAWSEKHYDETEIRILKRFGSVIDLTFRRYTELQKSEAIARDAVRDASLDRVRAEIASMRSTDDLERITPLIWNELSILGIPFIRCGVFIVDEQEQLIHTHLSTSDGKGLATFDLTFESDGIGQDVLTAWRSKQIATVHWSEEEFATYTKNLVDQGTVASSERYVTEHPDTSLDLHFFPFLQGMLYVGNVTPLTDDEKDLVQSLADAFSTAYARYEDFNKLEAAKQQVENTLADLKATQTKLIQSEKMASLGELTAGIAHEIQNPLNFVNNFSEVNQEMIDELEEELRSGNIEEALAIAADIKQNEEKINHHGKRADGIVKGMLAHSRTGGGEKQPTSINALADEFLRLSYHGLRAKDKAFNAEMITHFDPNLPSINVIPQDMGRVMLNLFNNAFYAVNQKSKTSIPGYKPEVMVTTELAPSSGGDGLLIKVKDNGIGMPEHIKEKIMQPFFTTKPTGEGTGLGLSLTYDMVVKGHGGSIQVNSKEGEGSEFIISLPLN